LIACDNGRFYTLGYKLPGARGFGEPVRSMVDIDADAHIVALIVYHPQGAIAAGRQHRTWFRAEADELLAETRKGAR
jgi:topoisomerase-4 subunit A